MARLLAEDWSEAAAAFEEALRLIREDRAGLQLEARWLPLLAEAYLGAGDWDRARSAAEAAITQAEERGMRIQLLDGYLALARVLIATAGASATTEIEQALKKLADLIEETGSRFFEPTLRVERAKLAGLSGDNATRERELREAYRQFVQMGATGRAEHVARELGL
jgi:hypothetical protein